MPISDQKKLKQLESYIGKQALNFKPFAVARISEVVGSAFVLKALAEEGACWPYKVIQLFQDQWKKDQTKLNALGLKMPTNAGIIQRLEDLEHEGFVRSLTPEEWKKIRGISARASEVYNLTQRGVAVVWLLNPIRQHDDVVLKILKRTDPDGTHKIPGSRLIVKLIERGKTAHFLRYAFTKASIELLHEIQEEEILPRIGPDIFAQVLDSSSKDTQLTEEELVYARHGILAFRIAAEIPGRISLMSREKQLRFLHAIGPLGKIQEELSELGRISREDPDIRESVAWFRKMISESPTDID